MVTVKLVCDAENLEFALCAATWLLSKPITQKDAILAYGYGQGEPSKDFYVKRGVGSIIVRQTQRAT